MVNVAKIGTATREIGAWLKAGGVSHVIETKPQCLTNIKGLKYARNLKCDTAQFAQNTHLSEPFVKSLIEIKGKDNLDTAIIIKDKILKKMGYKNPELLKCDIDSLSFEMSKKLGATGGYNYTLGKLDFSEAFLNLPIENQISLLYHELDHMDKFVKLYKAVGGKYFKNLSKEAQKNSPIYEAAIKKFGSIDAPINFDFYEQMSKELNIQGFDVKKWSKAFKEYGYYTPNYNEQYRYYFNPFEESAYNLQSKIQKILGLPAETSRDLFPKNYNKMINLLKEYGITDFKEQETIIKKAEYICKLINIDDRLGKFALRLLNGTKLTSKETDFLEKTCLDFAEKNIKTTSQNVNFTQKVFADVETYFRKGLFTPEEIVNQVAYKS